MKKLMIGLVFLFILMLCACNNAPVEKNIPTTSSAITSTASTVTLSTTLMPTTTIRTTVTLDKSAPASDYYKAVLQGKIKFICSDGVNKNKKVFIDNVVNKMNFSSFYNGTSVFNFF